MIDIRIKISAAESYANMNHAKTAERLGVSAQSYGKRLKTGKFTLAELENIAAAIGCKFEASFVFPDGTRI